MLWIDQLLVVILEFSALAFILLASGVLALRIFKQPIERIRLIQVSLASVFLATLFGHSSWLPSNELAWLPVEVDHQNSAAVVTPTSARSNTGRNAAGIYH